MSLQTTLRYSIYGVSVVLTLIGIAFIIAGAVLLTEFLDDGPKEELKYSLTFIFMILSGIGIVGISITGWCDAKRENRCWILTVAILLTVLFFFRMLSGVLNIVRGSEKSDIIERRLEKQFFYMDVGPKQEKKFQSMEKELECCGLRGPNDYLAKTKFIPLSCCRDKKNCNTEEAYWETGCIKANVDLINKTTTVLATLDFIAALFLAVDAGLFYWLRFLL